MIAATPLGELRENCCRRRPCSSYTEETREQAKEDRDAATEAPELAAEARRFVSKPHSVQSTREWILKGSVAKDTARQAGTSAELKAYMTKAGVPVHCPTSDESGSE